MYEETREELIRLRRLGLITQVVEDDLGCVYTIPTNDESYAIIRIHLYIACLEGPATIRVTARRFTDKDNEKIEMLEISAHDILNLARLKLKKEIAFNLDLWIEILDRRKGVL